MIVAIPCDEGTNAIGDCRPWLETGELFEQDSACPSRGYVAGLHRQVVADGLAADCGFDGRDEVIESDRLAAADIHHAIGAVRRGRGRDGGSLGVAKARRTFCEP